MLNVDSHHPPLFLSYSCESCASDSVDTADQFDFCRCNIQDLNLAIQQVDWDFLTTIDDTNDMIDTFYRSIYDILNTYVPRRKPTEEKKVKWWNDDLTRLRNQLRKAKKRYSRTPSSDNKTHMDEIDSMFALFKEESYLAYINSTERWLKQNPVKFWDYVRSKRGSSGLPANLVYNDRKSTSPIEAVELCADFFKTTFAQHGDHNNTDHLNGVIPFDLNIPALRLSTDEVRNALLLVDPRKGPGPDKLSPRFLKDCASSLALPVCIMFNHSLQSGTFPTAWKVAAMVPIHKAGSRHNVENYRGISILCSLAKVFEVFVYNRLRDATRHIITEAQHGFVRKRSTVSNLMVYTPYISNALGNRQQVDSIYIDFTKAFDRVSHSLILDKLHHLGLPSWLIKWLKSYLQDRKAYVKYGRNMSKHFHVTSGVPQGSHLGPLLFNLFINDVVSVLKSDKIMYADDLKFFRTIKGPGDHMALQHDLDALLDWCRSNAMQINAKKCKVISFHRTTSCSEHIYIANGEPLERVESIRDLGVIVDKTLSFKEHLATTIAKARTTLGFICRNTQDFQDIETLKILYISLVRSTLEYGVQVWAPRLIGEMKQYEGVQRKFLRYALRRLPWNDPIRLPSYEDRLRLIRLDTAASRIVLLRRMFIFDILSGNIESADLLAMLPIHVPPRNLRDPAFLRIPNLGWRSFHNPFYICCNLFNSVYVHFELGISKNSFKYKIRSIQSV